MPGGLADPKTDDWAVAEGPAARYRALTRHLAAATAAGLLELWRRTRDGQLTDDDLADIGSSAVVTANMRGASLADLYLAHLLGGAVIGLTAPPDTDRLAQAIKTAASDDGTNPQDALGRLGQSEPLRASQLALTDGMRRREVRGWTRVTSGAPCVVCAGLADGSVMPPDVDMYHHPGCSCVAQPVSD